MDDLYQVWKESTEKTLIIDNRSPEEYAREHVPGSRNIPMGGENALIDELKNYEAVYIYCRSGRRAQTMFTNLSFQGLDNIYCVSHSGMPDWIATGYPVEN